MNKTINIQSKKAKSVLKQFKNKRYSSIDIQFENVHLKQLNKLLSSEVFFKNDLFVNSTTLFELMQPVGQSGNHNYHGLLPEDILECLKNLIEPEYIIESKNNRFIIVPMFCSSYNLPLMVIIEIGAGLSNNKNANINKLVTIYPKSELGKYIKSIEANRILYIKK